MERVLKGIPCTAILMCSLVATLHSDPIQADDSQINEIEQLRLQIEILDEVRALNSAIKESSRYLSLNSDFEATLKWLQGNEIAGPEQGIGYLIGQIRSTSAAIGVKSTRLSNLMQQVEKPAGRVKQVLNAANAMTRLARAAAEAERSSGDDKLNDLGSFFGEVNSALPLLSVVMEGFAVNPVIGAYFIVIGKALSAIADSAEIIEKRTNLTNEIIANERARVLGPAPAQHVDFDADLNEARDAMIAELRRLEREVDQPAYTDVRAAEMRCMRERGIEHATLSSLQDDVIQTRTEARDTWQDLRSLEIGERANKEAELSYARIHLQTVEESRKRGAASEIEVERARNDIHRLEADVKNIDAEIEGFVSHKLRDAIERFESARAPVIDFSQCVRHWLEQAQYADNDFLEKHFPQHAAPNSYWELPDAAAIAERLRVAIAGSFRITEVDAPASVVSGGARGDLKVFYSGSAEFPIRLIYRPSPDYACPGNCISPERVFPTPDRPLVFPGAMWCYGVREPVHFDYEVVLIDASGAETEPVFAPFTCVPD